MLQAYFNTPTNEWIKPQKYQTHLTKEVENQQQANNRTKKKHSVTNKMKADEINNKHNQPYPSNKERNVSNTISIQIARKTFIKQGI